MATRLIEQENESFRAILNDSSHFLFLCNLRCRKPFFKKIIAASSRLAAEKLALSTYFNFVYHVSREFCSLISLYSSINRFYKYIPQSIFDSDFFSRAGFRELVIFALHLGRQKASLCYSCQLRLPSKDSLSSYSLASSFSASSSFSSLA